ncbi:conserved hypothetical protein [Escherichia coli]|nr:conserved hypothetical protein [Escherichia coli]
MLFRLPVNELRNTATGFPNLVTENKQDLTPCYPQKAGITVKNLHYCFHLQP